MSDKNQKIKKSSGGWKKFAAVEFAAIIALGGALGWSLYLRDNDENEKTVPVNAGTSAESEPEVRTRAVIEKEETFYQLSGKKILYKDSAIGEVFLPVYEDVPACSLDMASLTTRNGYSFYRENGETSSIAGIDVSEFQGDIDWEKVKAAGIDFVIVRVGVRTYGGGDLVLDKKYAENISGAQAAGLHVGAYFFSQATSTDEAIEEADKLIDAVAPYDITYPLIFDWEIISGDSARTDTVSVDTLADCCIAFCERVKSAGYTPMIYQNKYTSMMKLDVQRLKDYDFWLAEYNTKPTYYYDFQMWQYASDGYIPGISGEVDMNICFRDYSKPGAPSVLSGKKEQPAETSASTTTTATATTTVSTTTVTTTADKKTENNDEE
ncbi:MAG: glycoside hydrolase family 25 protein [Ruminococcus sp.]|nr:glycoside hydrolase family 25 protein [Ruminococcus sp.]